MNHGIEPSTAGQIRKLFQLEESGPAAEGEKLARSAIDDFYRMATGHEDIAPLFEGSDLDRLKQAQLRHWTALFAARSERDLDAVLATSERIGRVHVERRIDTSTYLAGYEKLTEDLIVGVVKSVRKGDRQEHEIRAILRRCFADIAASIASFGSTSNEIDSTGRLMAMSDSLEREMSTTLSEVRHQVQTLSQVAGQLENIAGDVTSAAGTVGASAQNTRDGVNIVASAAQELEASSQQISDQTTGAAQKAESTLSDIEEAKRAMAALTESAAAIGDVTELVRSIAKQTRLLALNATIEAARAGDAGKGFAVVAGEVKSLAAETENAIASVTERTQQISASTDSVNLALGSIVTGVEELSERAGSVSSSADEQRAAIAEIARSAERASLETGQVADQIGAVQDTAKVSLRAADRLAEIAGRLGRDVGDLQRRITTMLRSSGVGDRRQGDRVAVGIPGTLSMGTASLKGHTVDLSFSGGLFFPGLDEEATGQEGTVEVDGIGTLRARVVGSSPLGTHLQFLAPTDTEIAGVRRVIEATKTHDAPLVTLCRDAADKLSGILSSALSSGRLDMEDLFDDDYVPIQGTDPVQYSTRFLALTDEQFPVVQEAVVAKNSAIVFCAAVDRNAYLPTHNTAFSKPQKPGETVWNTANSRNRRIFDDRAGLLAARNTDEHKIQSYVRDMGGGNKQVLKEIDCPIRVADRIWGNLRLAYRN
ncbi:MULTISPECIES: methyl-accepting chemotaxis protein [Thalassobaculum]|uniref:Methyl-accepting chemotaxis protein n=1 Tax=Thalassobaculum litoreum DSM 18839 TaxID=1123362 RepID=A0A8G2BNF6_9PROT|nr:MULTISPECIES: methyl-accepting chemotaxis protein [Thalassobaculum]SDG31571.1 methyl-accepting chemotaxis protein [Thalassobaculum litoreum DSM 18839]